ncbi:XRE family transcriptional regulator [Actinomycetes bacterium KLBMP 9797]
MPDAFWTRQDVREALGQRDFGTVFKLLGKYTGASQTQIAIAVGMTQGQVSTIISGSRQVTAIDVAERALDGMAAPDDARIAFGLAPRNLGQGDGRHGLPHPRRPDTEIRDRAEPVWEDNVHRRDVLRLGAATFGGTALVGAGTASGLGGVARALTSYGLLTGRASGDRMMPAVGNLTTAVASAKRSYQGCRYSATLEVLPALLESVQIACSTADGDDLLRFWALAADAYQVTGSVMLKFGDLGLAAFAAHRSMEAAVHSQSPIVLAVSARTVTHSLMAGGHAERAKEVASRAAERLDADVPQPDGEALSVYGALLLRGAVAAAADEDRSTAADLLREAENAGRRLGRDDNAHWTGFGPTNVAQHRVHVAMKLGDAGMAVDLARQVDLGRIPLTERKAALFIDTAQALAQWGKHDRAYHALRSAEQVAPEEVRTKGSVRRLVAELAVTAPRSIRSDVREFAERIGAEA